MLLFPCSVYIKPGLVSFASCMLAPAPVSPGTLDYSRLCLHPCGASQTLWGLEGAVLGGMLGDSGHSPQDNECFVGFDHFPFSCFSTKVFQSCGIPLWHPKQRKPMERLVLTWLLSAAAAVDSLLPPDPPGTPRVPALGWGFLPCTAQRCHISCSSHLCSGKIHMLPSGQSHLKSPSTWTHLRAGKSGQRGTQVPPWSCLERRGKAKGTWL